MRAAEPADPLARLVEQFGQVYSQGRYADAAKVSADILGYLQSHRGPLDLDLAANLNNLGSLAYAQEKLNLAEPFFRKSLEIYEQVLGPADANVGAVLYNLAGLCVEQNRLDEALVLYQRSLTIRETVLGPEHPLVAETLNNLGFVYLSQSKDQDAEGAFLKAQDIWRKHVGTDAPYGAITLNNLGRLKTRQRRFAEAESYFSQAQTIEEQIFGKEHPEAAVTLLNLADLHRAAGETERALDATRQALDLLGKTLGPGDPVTMNARRRLAELESDVPKASHDRYQIIVVRQRSAADALRQKILNGAPFEALAREYSIDPSRGNGGYFEADPHDLNETVQQNLKPLQEGEISAPFNLGRNWAIVKKAQHP